MAGSVNKVILIGYLGADPDIRRTQGGNVIANMRVATSESWRDRTSGERREKTEWHTVVIFNEALAKIAEQYLKKGAHVYIEGKLQTRKWQDQSGADRYSTEIVLNGFDATLTMLGGNPSNRPPSADSPDDYGHSRDSTTRSAGTRASPPASGNFSRDLDDDIPF